MDAGRRGFVSCLVVGGAGLALGCGQDDETPAATPNCSTGGGTARTISANHGHELAIPAAHFSAGVDQTYSILGTATHDHPLTLTAAQLAIILSGGSVQVTSAEGGTTPHTHVVTPACGTSGNPGGGGDYDPGY